MSLRKPPTAHPSAYTSLEQLLSAPQVALQAFLHALTKGNRNALTEAITQIKQQGLSPDQVVFRCSSVKEVLWYQPAALVLAMGRPNAHLLLQAMLDQDLDILRHCSGPLQPGESRPLAHAFVQGWSAARPAPIKKFDPTYSAGIFDDFDSPDQDHRLDSRAILRLLHREGLDWCAPSSSGQTILHQAMEECEIKDLRTVVLLGIGKGVAPSARDHSGKSAIDMGRTRLGQDMTPGDRESLQALLAEMSQASLADNTCYSGPADRRAQPRI